MLKNSKQITPGGVIEQAGSSMGCKTGSWKSFRPVRDAAKCIHCAMCVIDCPESCIPIKDGKVGDADLDYCKGCGICAQVCPVKCIAMKKE